MSVIVTADLHLNDNLVDSYRHKWVDQELPRMLLKYKAKRLLLLGDITDAKHHHSAELTNQIVQHFVMLSNICPIIVLNGNHDGTSPDMPFFKFVNHLDNVTWITQPKFITLGDLGSCLFLPHTRDYKKAWEGIDFHADWIFSHQTFQGADVGARRLDGIPITTFPQGACVIAGDVHVPQILSGDDYASIIYVGAPYTCTFGDTYNPRVLLLSPDLSLKSIPCRGPRKCLVEAKDAAQLYEARVARGDIVKCTVDLPSGDLGLWPAILREVQAWATETGVILHSVHPVLEAVGARTAIQAVRKTDNELLQAYAQRRGVSAKILTTGMELIK